MEPNSREYRHRKDCWWDRQTWNVRRQHRTKKKGGGLDTWQIHHGPQQCSTENTSIFCYWGNQQPLLLGNQREGDVAAQLSSRSSLPSCYFRPTAAASPGPALAQMLKLRPPCKCPPSRPWWGCTVRIHMSNIKPPGRWANFHTRRQSQGLSACSHALGSRLDSIKSLVLSKPQTHCCSVYACASVLIN